MSNSRDKHGENNIGYIRQDPSVFVTTLNLHLAFKREKLQSKHVQLGTSKGETGGTMQVL